MVVLSSRGIEERIREEKIGIYVNDEKRSRYVVVINETLALQVKWNVTL